MDTSKHVVITATRSTRFHRMTSSLEWLTIQAFTSNVLIRTRTPELVVRAVSERLHRPIQVLRDWQLPQIAKGTLIVRGLDNFGLAQQVDLVGWLTTHHDDVRCVSLIRRPLYPLVRSGRFLADLYYRLNTIYINEDVVGSK